MPRPESKDPWTVKEALAHIAYWKEHTARVIRGERRPPQMRGLEVSQINRILYERWRERRPAEMLRYHRRVHEDVMRTLAEKPPEWFGRRERSAFWPGDLRRPLSPSSGEGHRGGAVDRSGCAAFWTLGRMLSFRYKQMSFAESETTKRVLDALGRILRRHREAASRSLVEVAESAGVSAAYLSEVERGLKDVSTDRLLAIARTLGVSLADFYQELGRELGAPPLPIHSWSLDPRLQLRRATASLSPDALRTVADFSVYLAMRQSPSPRRRIGFSLERGPH